jgi:hypothetical protein
MQTTYHNRTGDNIIFEKLDDNSIKMSGYNSDWMRFSIDEKDLSEAYSQYLKDVSEMLEEPDTDILFEDIENNKLRGFTPSEFKSAIYHNSFSKYRQLAKYAMIDPSGGPYITVGTNIKWYFEQKEPDMIVESISIKEDHVILKIK